MLTLEEIKEKVIPIAEKYEIPIIYLFGSYAKGTFLEKNKIDIAYNASYSKATGNEKLSLQEDLEKVLEIPVNLLRIKNPSIYFGTDTKIIYDSDLETIKNFLDDNIVLYENDPRENF